MRRRRLDGWDRYCGLTYIPGWVARSLGFRGGDVIDIKVCPRGEVSLQKGGELPRPKKA